MLTPQFLLSIHNELVVDLFAGGGGASTSMTMMVRALLDGGKTQTRRAVKKSDQWPANAVRAVMLETRGTAMAVDAQRCSYGPEIKCPYGQPGDRLWVREAFRLCAEADASKPRDTDAAYRIWYEADAPHQPGFGKLRPGMFMPRWTYRLVLTLKSVRVERLQDISRGDAMGEGCPFPNMARGDDPRQWYADLWDQINGPGAWSANPWVWVIEFKRTAS